MSLMASWYRSMWRVARYWVSDVDACMRVPARVSFDEARLAGLGDQCAVIGNSRLHVEVQPFAFAAIHAC